MEVRVHSRPPIAAADSHPWERVAADLRYQSRAASHERLEACRFRHESPHVRVKQMFTDYAEECFPAERPVLACAEALMTKLHCDLEYAPGETTIATPVTEVLSNRRGVCQDFAHLMIACLRSRGLAARYVSGYVRTLQAKDPQSDSITPAAGAGRMAESDDGVQSGADGNLIGGAASHAWVSVYSPPFGWVDLDPTNDTYVGTDHIAIAWGRDFGDVSPLRGVILGGGRHSLAVQVSVERLGD
jgi:transglutaminase-like putative cysteine protease